MFDFEDNAQNAHGNDILQMLQNKLKTATKLKLSVERHSFTLLNTERNLREELYSAKSEVEQITQQLEDLKDKISAITYRISKTEIQKVDVKIKLDNYIDVLKDHQKGFVDMFAEEHSQLVLRNKELKEKIAEEMELEVQKQNMIDKQNQLQVEHAATIEAECNAIEKECVVLKKRNAAIMLKLRRKLVEAEDTRRELLSRRGAIPSTDK